MRGLEKDKARRFGDAAVIEGNVNRMNRAHEVVPVNVPLSTVRLGQDKGGKGISMK